MKTPKISIVMGYFNRKEQFLCTMRSIQRSAAASQVEVILADDGSSREHILGPAELNQFSFPIEVWRVEPENKRWKNPTVAYNLAMSKAKGEWIILQNPEVQHIGDICNFIAKASDPAQYHVFSVFASANLETNGMIQSMSDAAIVPQIKKKIKGNWYCHPHYRPKAYHFCTAIHHSKMEAVGGFNPIMQHGIDYDDDEILTRITRVCRVNYVRTPGLMGIHLWHPRYAYQDPNLANLRAKNKALHAQTLRNTKLVKVDTQIQESGRDFHKIYPQLKGVAIMSVVIKKNVLTITGIRPDFIRMSEVFKKLDTDPAINHIMMHTGQHYDTYLSETFFKDLGLRAPDYQLATGTSSKNHYEQLSYLSVEVIKCIKENKINPDLILFLGDSNTSAVALPLKKEGYVIGHIEAGMRSHDRRMLEEMNRTVCDVCSELFFVYHEDYKKHLLNENINRNIYVVGNTVVEPCEDFIQKLKLKSTPKRKDMILMDIHRPENFNSADRLKAAFDFANRCIERFKVPVKCLYFKRLDNKLKEFKIDLGSVEMIPLLSYPDYLTQVYHSRFLFSDSGTGQEEPALLNTPVIVPRDYTERPQSFTANCSRRLPLDGDNEKHVREVATFVSHVEDGKLKLSTDWLRSGSAPTSTQILNGIKEFLKC